MPYLISSSYRLLIEPMMSSVDGRFKNDVDESGKVVRFASDQLLGGDLRVDDEPTRGGEFGVRVDFTAEAQTESGHRRPLQTT